MVGTWAPQYGAAAGVGGFRDLGLGSTWDPKEPTFLGILIMNSQNTPLKR